MYIIYGLLPSECYRYNLPNGLVKLFLTGEVKSIRCVTLGPREGSYFISYIKVDGAGQYCENISQSMCLHIITWANESKLLAWKNLPDVLEKWLNKGRTESNLIHGDLFVTLGQNDSFFASSSVGFRWGNLTPALEERLQDQLTPTGWRTGPPVSLSIGTRGNFYLVTSQYVCWRFTPEGQPALQKWFPGRTAGPRTPQNTFKVYIPRQSAVNMIHPSLLLDSVTPIRRSVLCGDKPIKGPLVRCPNGGT